MEEQDSRSYLASKVHPLFEKLLIELLIAKPEDPVEFMTQWLATTGQQYRPQEKQNVPFSVTLPVQSHNQMQAGTPRRSQVQTLQNPILNRQQSNQAGSNNHIPHLQSNQQLSHQHSSQPINSQQEINSQQLINQNHSKQGLEQSDLQQKSFEASQHEAEHHFDQDPKFGSGDQLSPSPIVADPKKSVHPFQKQQSVLTQKFQPQSNNNKSFKKSQTQANPMHLQPITMKQVQPQILVNNTPREQSIQQMKSSQVNSVQQSQQGLIHSKDEQEILDNQQIKRNSLTDSKEQLIKQQQQQHQQQQQQQQPQQPQAQIHQAQQQQDHILTNQNQTQINSQKNLKVIPKNKDQKSRVQKKIITCYLFKHLNDQQKEIVANAMEEKKFKAAEIIIKQGDDGDQLFLVDQGLLDCQKRSKQTEEKIVKSYQPGDFFGEMALLYNEKRAATIIAFTDCVLWVLDKVTFDTFIKQPVLEKRQTYDGILQKFPILQQIDPYLRQQIADALHVVCLKAEAIVFKQKDKGDYFYLIQQGQLKALKKGEEDEDEEQCVFEFSEYDYFGELAMLKEINRQATIVCETDCILLGLDKQSFTKLLAPIHDIIKQGTGRYLNFSFN